MLKLLFLDTETTGLIPSENGIIQISGHIDHVNSFLGIDKTQEFDFQMKPFPGQKLAADALKLQGLTKEDLKARQAPEEVYPQIINMFDAHVDRYNKADKFIMVGQNPKFDYDFMTAWFKRNGNNFFYAYVDYHLLDIAVFSTAFKVLGKLKVDNTKLGTVCKALGIPLSHAHNSKYDIEATRKIFYQYLESMKDIKNFEVSDNPGLGTRGEEHEPV